MRILGYPNASVTATHPTGTLFICGFGTYVTRPFAHSDADAYRVRVSIREWKEAKFAIPTHWYGLEPLPKDEVALLDSMIDELNGRISQERHRIQELLNVDDRF